MASWTSYKGLEIPDSFDPDDNAGEKLTNDLKLLADNFDALDAGDIITGTLAVAYGGTGTSTAFTQGSIVFAGASGIYSQDNSNLFWDNTNKRLGIGTATPASSSRLHIRATSATSPQILIESTSSRANRVGLDASDNGCVGSSNNTPVYLMTANVARVYCNSANANVGVANTNPQSLLHVGTSGANGRVTVEGTGTAWFGILAGNTGNVGSVAWHTTTSNGLRISRLNDGPITIGQNTNATFDSQTFTEQIRIDTSGHLGIGDNNPQSQLSVVAGSSSTLGALIKGATSQSANLQEWQNSGGSVLVQFDANGGAVFNEQGSSSADFRIEGDTDANLLFADASADKIGIGVNAPSAKLDVNSDTLRLRTAKTPSSASDTGNQGDIAWDSNYVYVCVATNNWKRFPLSTW